jgi:hypothetical protein
MTLFLDYLGTMSELNCIKHEHDCAATNDAAESGSLDVWKRYKYPRFLSLAYPVCCFFLVWMNMIYFPFRRRSSSPFWSGLVWSGIQILWKSGSSLGFCVCAGRCLTLTLYMSTKTSVQALLYLPGPFLPETYVNFAPGTVRLVSAEDTVPTSTRYTGRWSLGSSGDPWHLLLPVVVVGPFFSKKWFRTFPSEQHSTAS